MKPIQSKRERELLDKQILKDLEKELDQEQPKYTESTPSEGKYPIGIDEIQNRIRITYNWTDEKQAEWRKTHKLPK